MKLVAASFLLLFFFTNSAKAEIYVREYDRIVTEFESIESSRAIAFDQIRRILLAELGVFINHELVVKSNDGSEKVSEDLNIVSAGFVSLNVLEEKVEQNRYYLKAELSVDPVEVKENLGFYERSQMLRDQITFLANRTSRLGQEIDTAREEIEEAKLTNKQSDIYYAVLDAYKQASINTQVTQLVIQGLVEANVRSNYVKACSLYIQAKNIDFSLPMLYGFIGGCYENGWFVNQNTETALQYYSEGISDTVQDLYSFLFLLVRKISGEEVPDNFPLSKSEAIDFANEKIFHTSESSVIGMFYYAIRKNDVPYQMIDKWAERFVYLRDGVSTCYVAYDMTDAYRLGSYRERIDFPISKDGLLKWLKRSAKCEEAEDERWEGSHKTIRGKAGFELYNFYIYGEHKNSSEAINYLEIAAKNNDIEALYTLSSLKKLGIYVERDHEQSLSYFQKARSHHDALIEKLTSSKKYSQDSKLYFLYRFWDGYKHYRGIGGPVAKDRALKIWREDLNIIRICTTLECRWADIVANSFSDTHYEQMIAGLRDLAKRGEANSIYDLRYITSGSQ